jgi:hypothetical protein
MGPQRVKTSKAQGEQMFSGLPPAAGACATACERPASEILHISRHSQLRRNTDAFAEVRRFIAMPAWPA